MSVSSQTTLAAEVHQVWQLLKKGSVPWVSEWVSEWVHLEEEQGDAACKKFPEEKDWI
jgi:hypothetical protein